MKRILLTYLFGVILVACNKDELGPQCVNCNNEPISETSNLDVLIVNEGNFGWGNASLSLYRSGTKEVQQQVFNTANGSSLGDVAQSATKVDDKIYVMVNNSNKIEVINAQNFTQLATISNLNSPRYLLPIQNNKAYVSDLYGNTIHIINTQSNTKTGSIATTGWTEKMLLHNDTAYVCDLTNDKLLIINPQTDIIVGEIATGVFPNSIVLDKDNKIWVLCSGGTQEEQARLIKINPTSRSVENTLIFSDINNSPNNMVINSSKDILTFNNSGIYQYSIESNSLPSTPIITKPNGSIFYGVGINPSNDEIYIADAIDYVQAGKVYRHSHNGTLIDQFESGIIPGNFLFFE